METPSAVSLELMVVYIEAEVMGHVEKSEGINTKFRNNQDLLLHRIAEAWGQENHQFIAPWKVLMTSTMAPKTWSIFESTHDDGCISCMVLDDAPPGCSHGYALWDTQRNMQPTPSHLKANYPWGKFLGSYLILLWTSWYVSLMNVVHHENMGITLTLLME